MSDQSNPLLEPGPRPAFDRIRPEHALPAIETLIQGWREALETAAGLAEPGWDTLVAVEEVLADRLDSAFAPVAHLHAVSDSPQWREAYGESVLRLSEFHTELNQDRRRFRAYRTLADGPGFAGLDAASRRVVDNTLRDFRLAGVELDEPGRARYAEIVRRLTELSTTFQQNLQDATDAWHLDFDDAAPLAGLPERALAEARQRAEAAGVEGLRVNLEAPSYLAVMTYAQDRALRERLYTAYLTRASDSGPQAGEWDNGPVIIEILALRRELARLVGFDHYVDYSLATKMANSPGDVRAFLQGLADRAKPRAEAELATLADFARQSGGPQDLAPWDVAFYSERLRQDRYAVSEEEVRPYFAFPAVLQGLLSVAGELFGVGFREGPQVPLWHSTVRYIEVLDGAGQVIASFYLDPYARTGKRGGAWMADCRSLRRQAEGRQRPVAFLTCNFPAPTDRPSLLSHDEVTTLFHEFGHGLHHLLTRIEHPSVGGISGVEWDAVELPSQFLENWCWQRPALDRFARHVDTGEALPEDLFQRLLSARHFNAGLHLVRQLEFALTDLELHASEHPDPATIQQQVRQQVAVIHPPDWTRFLNGFSHLFAGGYAAGYYSYLWAEQLAADAFSRFEEEGVFNTEAGQDFRREVLEVGGSRDAIESFRAFRGRDPVIEPLLRSYGIEETAP